MSVEGVSRVIGVLPLFLLSLSLSFLRVACL